VIIADIQVFLVLDIADSRRSARGVPRFATSIIKILDSLQKPKISEKFSTEPACDPYF
jgi:hypothetical protein